MNFRKILQCSILLILINQIYAQEHHADDYWGAREAWQSSRVDSHAPIGVMGDHTHAQGEWMLSYRYMNMAMKGHRAGTESLSSEEVFEAGYEVAATKMDMQMHMLGAMYGVNDRVTLMGMLSYVRKDMELVAAASSSHHGHSSHHAQMMGHSDEASHSGHSNHHGHSSEGWGDFQFGAMFDLGSFSSKFAQCRHRWHFNALVSLPTADVSHQENANFLPYGMQSGSGTWDLKPTLTYLGQSDSFSWGAQFGAIIRLDENESGFRYGDQFSATTWLARPITGSISLSGRLSYRSEEAIEGLYNGSHGMGAPPLRTANYGGEFIEASVGLNFYFAGHRFALEFTTPLEQDLNGVGMERDYSLSCGWQKAF